MLDRLPELKRARGRAFTSRSGAVSLLAHALLLFWLVGGGAKTLLLGSPTGAEDGPGQGTGIGEGPAGGGGGGAEVVTFYEIPTPPAATPAPEAPPEPEVPVEEILPPLPTPSPIPPVAVAPAVVAPSTGEGAPGPAAGAVIGAGSGPGSGPGSGGGSGGGTGGGTGSGTGPGTGRGGGEGDDGISAPVPQAVIFPPPAPKQVRGRTVTLKLAVDARGRVQDVEVLDPSGDSGYDRRLERTAREWRFNPARDRSGRPIAAPYEISFTF